MKKLSIIAALLLVSACTPSYESGEGKFLLPPELGHCNVYRLRGSSAESVIVVSCPDRNTLSSSKQGKHKQHSVVVE